MITIFSALIAVACGWAVFDTRICDGLVSKHALIFASIFSSLSLLDERLTLAFLAACVCAGIGSSIVAVNHIFRRLDNLCRD